MVSIDLIRNIIFFTSIIQQYACNSEKTTQVRRMQQKETLGIYHVCEDVNGGGSLGLCNHSNVQLSTFTS